ncbi:MAG: c-type cytochrome [Acidobacteriaceae bacterium]
MQRMPARKSVMLALLFGFSFHFLVGEVAPSAQTPSPPTSGAPHLQPLRIPDKFTNLQILPKNIDREHLLARMNQYSGQLGVRCSFCHVLNPETGHADFASDAKPEKRAARLMIRMTGTINAKFLKQLPAQIGTGENVSCYTCHRGHSRPVTKPAGEGLSSIYRFFPAESTRERSALQSVAIESMHLHRPPGTA